MSLWWSTGQVNMVANMQAAAYRKPPKEEQATTKSLCTPLYSHLVSFLQIKTDCCMFCINSYVWQTANSIWSVSEQEVFFCLF